MRTLDRTIASVIRGVAAGIAERMEGARRHVASSQKSEGREGRKRMQVARSKKQEIRDIGVASADLGEVVGADAV